MDLQFTGPPPPPPPDFFENLCTPALSHVVSTQLNLQQQNLLVFAANECQDALRYAKGMFRTF